MELLERYLPRLRTFIRLRSHATLRRHESSADLAQSVCREVLEGLHRFRWRGEAEFAGFLCTAALAKIVSRMRYYGALKRRAPARAPQDDDAPEEHAVLASLCSTLQSPSQAASTHEQVERLRAALDTLPADQVEAVTLARIMELPRSEVARVMDRSEEAVSSALARAMARLSTLLSAPAGAAPAQGDPENGPTTAP